MRYLIVLSLVAMFGCLPKPADPALRAVDPVFFDANLGTGLALIAEALLPPTTLDFDQPAKSPRPSAVVSAFIDDGTTRVDLLDVQWVDSTRVTGRLPGPVPIGVYDVHLIEPRGTELVLAAALSALDCSEGDCPLEDGGIPDSGVVACTTMSYRDRDLDGFGSGTPRTLCGPGWAPLSGDCDDRDGLTSPGAFETCNGVDDDCDGLVDEGRCADAGWTAVDQLRMPNNDLLASASFAPGGLWIAAGSRVFVRRFELGFFDLGPSCPSDMQAVWAQPDGDAEVAGADNGAGRIAEQSYSSIACTNERAVSEPPVAMVGFSDGLLGFQYVAVLDDGRLLRWVRGQQPALATSNLPSSAEVTDLHGVAADQLYAVGSTVIGNSRRPMIWALQADGGWREELSGTGNQGRLLGVWALSAVDVIAVGEDGRIYRRSASGWRPVSSDTSSDLTSVRAFSPGRFYVTTSDGRVRRRSGNTWTTVFRNDVGVRFNDLSATSEEDVWAVGDDGVIGRGPR
ncbi:MAG: putative metal-binding motif-containing protein [Archangium sp.]|nr:putative metal-binding motif-containing protein [Archangium sp.]